MLWIKSLHIVLVASWFAGLFYLPRIFVNLAMETDPAATARLLTMARKLFRFMTFIAVPALACGLWLLLVVGIGQGQGFCCAGSCAAKIRGRTSGIACSTSCPCSGCLAQRFWLLSSRSKQTSVLQ
jgi:uncharacterized membrane protein